MIRPAGQMLSLSPRSPNRVVGMEQKPQRQSAGAFPPTRGAVFQAGADIDAENKLFFSTEDESSSMVGSIPSQWSSRDGTSYDPATTTMTTDPDICFPFGSPENVRMARQHSPVQANVVHAQVEELSWPLFFSLYG